MESVDPPTWNIFVDGSSGEARSRTGIVLISPEGHKLNCIVRFGFKATNNVVEYEVLLVGLRLAREMQVKRLHTNCDSQLVSAKLIAVLPLRTRAWRHILSKSSNSFPLLKSSSWHKSHKVKTPMPTLFQVCW